MNRYRYIKQKPKRIIKIPRFIPYAFLLTGTGLLLWTLWPILSFALISASQYKKTVSPVQEQYVLLGNNNVSTVNVMDYVEQENLVSDYTNPNMWFPTKPQKKIVAGVNSYTISIPKLGIKDAIAVIAGDDLDKNLIHYGGTGLPGEFGNTVVFGHSTLPQFFNPNDYHSIFSTLPTLNFGDDIVVRFDNVKYTFTVVDMTVTDPNDLTPLEQRYDDSYLTLITCVPPGTYAKRLNVRARLQSI